MPKLSKQTLFFIAIVSSSMAVAGYLLFFHDNNGLAIGPKDAHSRLTLEDIPFNGRRAHQYLEQICQLGSRVSGSPGMVRQQQLLADHFQKLGATVRFQELKVRHPLDGSPVSLANLIAQWHPERKERILLCAHYDTRPFPDRDSQNPRGLFVGANDGGSGTALLMELAHELADLPGGLGVDVVLFDAEELVYQEGHEYFLGSDYFARDYVANPPPYRYRWGMLLDMVGDSDLQIYQERHSSSWRDTKPLVKSIWDTARRLGVREFIPKKGQSIRDDHLKLHDIAGIPTVDIIDFDYPHWHTTGDTHDKCSPLSLAKVGYVVSEWLKTAAKGS